MQSSVGERKESIEALKAKEPSKEALERKGRSIAKLNKENVPVLKNRDTAQFIRDVKMRPA